MISTIAALSVPRKMLANLHHTVSIAILQYQNLGVCEVFPLTLRLFFFFFSLSLSSTGDVGGEREAGEGIGQETEEGEEAGKAGCTPSVHGPRS